MPSLIYLAARVYEGPDTRREYEVGSEVEIDGSFGLM